MVWQSVRLGWGTRHPLEVLARTAILHGVLVANYMHLQHIQKVQHSSRVARMLRFVLFAFMPTLIVAELLLDLCRVFLLFLRSDPSLLSLQDVLYDWKRYLCAVAGVHVAPKPVRGGEDEAGAAAAAHEGLLNDVDSSNESRGPAADAQHYSPRLSKIQESRDLQQHHQSWTLDVAVRILLLVLAILQAVGTIVLFARRLQDSYYHWPMELDKRNLIAAIASIVCSVTAIIILLCRSDWSLKSTNSGNTSQGDYVVRTFFLEIVLASVLNEAPFAEMWEAVPQVSWSCVLVRLLGPIGFVLLMTLSVVAWLVVWFFEDKIKQKITINWHFVVSIPMVIITGWIFVDLTTYFIFAVYQLCGVSSADSIWDKDPVANYLPICG